MTVTINGTSGITTPGVNSTASNTLGDAVGDTLNVGNGTIVTDSSGNVGIGTSSPSKKLEVATGTSGYTDICVFRTADTTAANNVGGGFSGVTSSTAASRQAYMWLDADGANFAGGDYFYIQKDGNNSNVTYDLSSNAAHIWKSNSGTERMRIDSSGNLLVGITAFTNAGGGIRMNNGAVSANITTSATSTGGWDHIEFRNANGIVGHITTTGTATAYVTSSDYRLKENIQPMQNALGVVQQLNPVTYTWKADGSDGQGFIAHELQDVVPDCVCGEKDAVDAEGNPVYQGIDTSFLVATLTKAIQELSAKNDALEARITALEAK